MRFSLYILIHDINEPASWLTSHPRGGFPFPLLYAPWLRIVGWQFALVAWFVSEEGVSAFGEDGCVEREGLRGVLAIDASDITRTAASACHHYPFAGIPPEQSGLVPCGGQGRHEVPHIPWLREITLRLVCPMEQGRLKEH